MQRVCVRFGFQALFGLLLLGCANANGQDVEGDSSRETRQSAAQSLPMARFNSNTRREIEDVVGNPSFFRRMPTQQIECDPQMLHFLVRRPEVLVNIWELMGITKVSAKRTTAHTFHANDGVGTQCVCDLVFSDSRMHVYYGNGDYDGSMTPRRVKGRCVCVLHTKDYTDRSGNPVVAGTMDVFLKLDNFGADMLTRTLGPFVGKTADYNFVETAKFISQISQLCTHSPAAAQGLAIRLTNIDENVRHEFAGIAARIAANSQPGIVQLEQPNPLVTSVAAPTPESSMRYYASDHDESPAVTNRTSARAATNADQLLVSDPLELTSPLTSQNERLPVGAQPLEHAITGRPPAPVRPIKPNAYMRR